MEEKQKILDLLLPALQETRNLYDLESLHYEATSECVITIFTSGFQKIINVAMDSGTSMIKDILRSLA